MRRRKILMEIDMMDHNSSRANSTDQYDTRRQKSSFPRPPKVMIYTVQSTLRVHYKFIYNNAAI